MDVSMADQALARYKCDSNTAVRFKLVQCENDVFDKGKEFHPTFSHQYFGDNETIFGYSNVEVQLYYHAGSLLTYIGMKHDGQVNSKGLEPDPVMSIVAERYPAGFLTNLDQFIAKLPGEGKFRPMGELLHSYKQNDAEYEMYQADITTPRLRDYHERLQTFLLWFIDASSYIDTDDERWHFFILFEKRKEAGETLYSLVGYMTVYQYYAYPDKIRPRISQMLILPPFKRQGHGAQMLQTVDRFYIKDPQVLDITVEDPSFDFLRLRDYVDALACINLSAFSQENLRNGFSGEMVKEAREKLKINKIQCRRVYEILRLRVTDLSNAEDYKSYRLEVKKRLNVPFQKEKADMEKLKLILKPEELSATVNMQTPQERMQHLEQLYQELESHYKKTLERIAAS
ncbi:unnamed protein product [Pocillopora meandrina]|uniref:Histone acetyltransferase type B catalytic subunit n=1 Tax=Pocillopora meandrina TaxID=46732 RepID=A0AAU9XPA0_9CNID|nr:unnamed protein product [Pocillopora meandrina]